MDFVIPKRQKAVIYARYSSDKQTEQSIEGQLRVCHEYAESNNIDIINEYIDRAISGRTDNRPAFQQMIEDSKQKQFDIILVYKVDRFSRNTYDSIFYKHQLKESNVKVVSATESISDTMEGQLIERILETMAEMYSKDLSQKVKRGMRESRIKRQFLGGLLPFGYKVEDKKIVIDEDTAPIAKMIFEEYANGKSKVEIVKYLNDNHYKSYHNKEFTENSFQNMLHNKKYIGIVEYEGEVYDNYCPAIISKELFDKVQNKLTIKRKLTAQRKAKLDYILSGHLYCGYCGARMIGVSGTNRWHTKHGYYACSKRYNYHQCVKKTEKKDFLEQIIFEEIIRQLEFNKQEVINSVYEKIQYISEKSKIEEYTEKIKKVDKEIDNICKLFIKTTNSDLLEKLNKQADDLSDLKKTYQLELNKLKLLKETNITFKEIEIFYNDCLNLATSNNINDKKKFLDLFVNCIFVKDNNLTIYLNSQTNQTSIDFETYTSDNNNFYNESTVEIPINSTTNELLCQGSSMTPNSPPPLHYLQ